MTPVRSVPWDDPDAVALRTAMLTEVYQRYADRMGEDITSANTVDDESVAYTGIATAADGRPVGHVALRWLGRDLEIKRMYVVPRARGQGVAQALMAAAEDAGRTLGAARLVLQTGDRQPEAVRTYEKAGYTPIPIFPPYEALTFSRCFAKAL